MITEKLNYPSCDKKHTVTACIWHPDNKPKAILQVVHGIAEHIGRYTPLAEELCKCGIVVCAENHLGHGETSSEEERGYFAEKDGWSIACGDTAALSEMVKNRYPGLSFCLMGHSMGSFMARTIFCKRMTDLNGLVLSGTGDQPLYIIYGGRIFARIEQKRIGKEHAVSDRVEKLAFSAYNNKFAPTRTAYDWISSGTEEVDAYIADPMCGFQATVRLFMDMLDGLGFIRKKKNIKKGKLDIPILMLSGAEDPVGGMGKSVTHAYRAFKACGANDIKLKLYPGMRHELLHEPCVRDDVIKEIAQFVARL